MKYVLFITFLVLFQTTMGVDLVETSCKKASDGNPNLKYNFCVKTLQADSKSHGADLAGLVDIALDKTKAKATCTKSTISNLLNDPKFNKAALKDCSKLYSDAIPTLQEATDAFMKRDYPTAQIRVSAAMDTADTCETGFKEQKASSPLTKENDDFEQLSIICLAFINQLRAGGAL